MFTKRHFQGLRKGGIPMKIRIINGDISLMDTDAVVNAANNHLWMGAGVAGALKRRGGQEIEKEAVAKGPIPVGEAVFTKGYNLPARYVIHAAVMGQDLRTSADLIRRATYNSMRVADELGLSSISFPALGTGVGGFPLDRCAEIMYEEILRYEREHPDTSIKEVVFVLYGDNAYNIFKMVVEKDTRHRP